MTTQTTKTLRITTGKKGGFVSKLGGKVVIVNGLPATAEAGQKWNVRLDKELERCYIATALEPILEPAEIRKLIHAQVKAQYPTFNEVGYRPYSFGDSHINIINKRVSQTIEIEMLDYPAKEQRFLNKNVSEQSSEFFQQQLVASGKKEIQGQTWMWLVIHTVRKEVSYTPITEATSPQGMDNLRIYQASVYAPEHVVSGLLEQHFTPTQVTGFVKSIVTSVGYSGAAWRYELATSDTQVGTDETLLECTMLAYEVASDTVIDNQGVSAGTYYIITESSNVVRTGSASDVDITTSYGGHYE